VLPTPAHVQPLVVIRGHLPTEAVLQPDVPVVGFDVLATYLERAKSGVRLRRIVEDIVGFFDRIKPGIHYQTGDLKIPIGRYRFTLSGFALTPEALSAADLLEPRVARVGRNEPCPCGSGKKYKRCHG